MGSRDWTTDQLLKRSETRRLELFSRPDLLPVVEHLPRLESLHLHGITLRDPGPVLRARGLRRLVVTLGSTPDFGFVRDMPALEELWIVWVRRLDDLDSLTGPPSLRVLWLENLPRIERLPDLAAFPRLERLELINLPSLRSLEPVLRAPALKQLKVGLKQADARMLEPLRVHPALEAGVVGTGSARRNAALNALLGTADKWDPTFALMRGGGPG